MTTISGNIEQHGAATVHRGFYRRVILMAVSALLLSAAIIIFFNRSLVSSGAEVQHTIELAANTFLPYMLSAVIAAITAIGIMTILPLAKGVRSAEIVQQRLIALGSGDLSSKVYLGGESESVEGLVGELNNTIGLLGANIAQWKVINRNHWELLQAIRTAAERKNSDLTLKYVAEMENSWEKIAAIEERLSTG